MLVNGSPAEQVDASDRGLTYGDGVFETVRFIRKIPILWEAHLERLMRGCERLKIPSRDLLSSIAADITKLAPELTEDCVVKIVVTRGSGARGYRPDPLQVPTRVVSCAEYRVDRAAATGGISASVCRTRLARNPALAGLKHLNRLEQVLGAAEIRADCAEGIMLDVEGLVIEGTRSNLIVAIDGELVTPALDQSGVAGTLRGKLIELANLVERPLSLAELVRSDEVLVCNSVFGLYSVREIFVEDTSYQFTRRAVLADLSAMLEDNLACRFA